MKVVESYLQEWLGTKPFDYENEDPKLKQLRTKNKYMYFFHGTGIKRKDKIKREGLKVTKFDSRNIKLHGDISPGIFLTPTEIISRIYALSASMSDTALYSIDYWKTFVNSKSEEPLLCRVETGHLDFFLTYKRYAMVFGWRIDEYIYYKNIPPKDIIFYDDPKFEKIVKKFDYLDDKRGYFY